MSKEPIYKTANEYKVSISVVSEDEYQKVEYDKDKFDKLRPLIAETIKNSIEMNQTICRYDEIAIVNIDVNLSGNYIVSRKTFYKKDEGITIAYWLSESDF